LLRTCQPRSQGLDQDGREQGCVLAIYQGVLNSCVARRAANQITAFAIVY
jgi:hypothetical protein